MKAKVFLRVARSSGHKGYRVAASTQPNYSPLTTGGYESRALPTAAFAMVLDIPDQIFHRAEEVLAEVELQPSAVQVAAEVHPE